MVEMLSQEEMCKSMSKLIGYDVQNFGEPVTLSRFELEELGREAQFEYELSGCKKLRINNEHWFGLYEFFTVPTQWCYCTKDDMYYILGMVKYTKDNQGKNFNTFYSDTNKVAITYANLMEYEHMKEVYKELFGEEWKGVEISESIDLPVVYDDMDILYKEIDKNFYVGNYFYYYRMYIYNMASYELILGIKEGF